MLKNTHQAHVMIGTRAYDVNDDRRMPLYLLNNMLGGPGMNAKLNLALREHNGLVYTVESTMVAYGDTGTWSIYFGCDETDMNQLANLLYKAGDEAVPQITGIFEALKKRGLDLRDNGSSSSTKNSIKSITEETADILASYLNAVRLDVSVIREMQGKFIPEMSEIAKSQLTQLNLIAQNTLRNADAAERIDKTVSELNDNFNRVINGTKSLKMK